jgi:hypothetical protein
MSKFKTDKLAVFEKDLAESVLASSMKHQTGIMLPAFCAALIAAQADDSDLLSDALNFLPSLVSSSTTPKLLNILLQCIVKLDVTHSGPVMMKLWPHLCSLIHISDEAQLHLNKLIEVATPEQLDGIISYLVQQNMVRELFFFFFSYKIWNTP